MEKGAATTKPELEEEIQCIRVDSELGKEESNSYLEEMDEEFDRLEKELDGQKKTFAKFTLWKKPQTFMVAVALFASTGGLLYGIDLSLISGANLYFPTDLHLSSSQESQVVSFMPLGGVFGGLILYPLNEIFGRKYTIIFACIMYTIGAVIEAASQSYGMLISGRLILGTGVGIELGSVPMYIAECSTRRWRGGLVSLYQLMIDLGLLFGYIDAAIFANVSGNWRYILGSSLLFSSILLFGMLFFPESPRWLMRKGRKCDAYRVWKQIRGFSSIDEKEEFFVMEKLVTEEREEAEKRIVWFDFIKRPRCRRAAIISIVFMILVEFSGINSISYYESTLLEKSGLSPQKALYASMGPGGVYFLATFPAVFLMDRWGRRAMILTLLPGIIIGCLITGFSFLASSLSVREGIYLWGVCLYFFWASCLGPTAWVIASEVFPTYLRSHGILLHSVVNMLGNFATAYPFTKMLHSLTPTGLFCGFYACCVLWIFSLIFIPETKGRTLEQIKSIYSQSMFEIAKINIKNSIEAAKNLVHFRWDLVWEYTPDYMLSKLAQKSERTRIVFLNTRLRFALHNVCLLNKNACTIFLLNRRYLCP
ncbi:hypothetical protein GpartN1_g7830.t1 [Galdieria partita]|uniref:Major facilitator superfamily (MFS) profile domain-containing protein n=1 Tax=Galdieria partita TaxID=83374 RepID=A0A9C7Q5R4_9RHOD|nr:hypothetical protein GpartN1_g7770.t1 [Galdieria partita]GJQ16039.1 hypothetical protein GpartN1_g7830.t1 [Galdieria partita]